MFKNPFSFEGRIRRKEYAISVFVSPLIILALCALIFYLITIISIKLENESLLSLMVVFYLLIMIPYIWFLLAQGTKRCHDIDRSGWYQLIPFYYIFLLFRDAYPGENMYGPNPKEIE